MPSAEGEERAADEQPKPSPIPRNGGDVKTVALVASSSAEAGAGAAVAAAAAVDFATVVPRRKRKKATPSPLPEQEEREERLKLAAAETPSEESRRMFQKLWTDADEITILEGFLEFTSQRGTTHADYQHDTGPFYEQIKGSLKLDFNRSQLVEKLRRLKKKYRNMAARMAADKAFAFRCPHDQATFGIASKIWNPTFKRANRSHDPAESVNGPNQSKSFELEDAGAPVVNSAAPQGGSFNSEDTTDVIPAASESPGAPEIASAHLKHSPSETKAAATYRTPAKNSAEPPMTVPGVTLAEQMMKSDSFWPLFKAPRHFLPGGEPCGLSSGAAMAFGERWKQQQILELEVYLKRVELVYEQVKSKLEELRSQQGISN